MPIAPLTAQNSIQESVPDAATEILLCDLGLQASVRAAAAELETRVDRLDVLVNNAGVTLRAPARTSEGHDEMLAINHLGPFLLTNELRPLLESSAPARVVNVSSNAHKIAKTVDLDHLDAPTSYGVLGFGRYGETKLMNILWTRELARHLDDTGVTANALHPGGVRTNLGNPPKPVIAVVGLFLVSPEKGAATSLYLATDPSSRRDHRRVLGEVPPSRREAHERGTRRRAGASPLGRERRARLTVLRAGCSTQVEGSAANRSTELPSGS